MDCGPGPPTRDLRDLTLAALREQGITARRLRWMGSHTTDQFRCDTVTGERLVVRVELPGGRTDAELDAELAWLSALARDTDLAIPVVRFSTYMATPSLPGGARCIAFEWVEGRRCGRRPSRRLVTDLGRVIGVLHTHSMGFRLPTGFTRPVLDIQYLTWAGSWHADQLARRPIDQAIRQVLSETSERVEAVLARIGRDPASYGLIHADLHLDNVLDRHGQACVIDFGDASFGHYALDLAIAVDSVPEPLRPALLGGYQTVRPLPPGYDEYEATMLAARRLFIAIWHLANGLPDDGRLDELRAFTES